MNALVAEIVRSLAELDLGLRGDLQMSEQMDSLLVCLLTGKVGPRARGGDGAGACFRQAGLTLHVCVCVCVCVCLFVRPVRTVGSKHVAAVGVPVAAGAGVVAGRPAGAAGAAAGVGGGARGPADTHVAGRAV